MSEQKVNFAGKYNINKETFCLSSQKMKIEIITIGDEILIGQIIDTNSAWMAAELTKQGFEIAAISSVSDKMEEIKNSIDIAFSRADAVLMTGGVGPTNDDITKKTLCDYFDTELVFDESVFENINQIFARKNIQMNERTKSQAYVPQHSEVIQNKVGTAPILWFNRNGKSLVSMPGVPFEMKAAMTHEILPRMKNRFRQSEYLKESFLVSGVSESALAQRLETFENELPTNFSLAYLPSFGIIKLRLSAWGEENRESLNIQKQKLVALLNDVLVSDNDNSLEELLGKKLSELNLTISTAESCTGGNIAHQITLVPGASAYFSGSIVSYINDIKINLLNVKKETIERNGAVSRQVVEEMAQNVSEILRTDCAIAVSGIAGPDGGTAEKPVGTVWICTKIHEKIESKKYQFGTSREENINRTTNMALLQMLKMLKQENQ